MAENIEYLKELIGESRLGQFWCNKCNVVYAGRTGIHEGCNYLAGLCPSDPIRERLADALERLISSSDTPPALWVSRPTERGWHWLKRHPARDAEVIWWAGPQTDWYRLTFSSYECHFNEFPLATFQKVAEPVG